MFVYEKKLQYPVKIKNPNAAMAKFIISQYGGPSGEAGAAMRYLSQRFSMPYAELKALYTDIGSEELGHLEMVGTIVHQLTRGLSEEELQKQGFSDYFVEHTTGVYPQGASGEAFSAATLNVKGDVFADLSESLAAEQKARVTYDNILRMVDDPDVRDPIKFLRAREIVHYQRFADAKHTHSNRFVYEVYSRKKGTVEARQSLIIIRKLHRIRFRRFQMWNEFQPILLLHLLIAE